MPETQGFTHFDDDGASRMVDVSHKPETARMARASGCVLMRPETLRLLTSGKTSKGDVLEVARIAGIQATKRTDELIPLCHSLGIDAVSIDYEIVEPDQIRISSQVRVLGRTGVEMEALTAVSIAALTIYDMCKAVDREIRITDICLQEKTGGKSGHFLRCKSNTESP